MFIELIYSLTKLVSENNFKKIIMTCFYLNNLPTLDMTVRVFKKHFKILISSHRISPLPLPLHLPILIPSRFLFHDWLDFLHFSIWMTMRSIVVCLCSWLWRWFRFLLIDCWCCSYWIDWSWLWWLIGDDWLVMLILLDQRMTKSA
jgi:hypothetical protein